jgi:uncharacterized protein (TIGR02611 family)
MSDEQPPQRPDIIERLLARREHHKTRSRFFRIAWGVVGTLVLVAGVVMLVTPGPAFLLIPIGLAMLALEFVWAERLLEHALEQAEKAREKAADTTTAQRVIGAVVGVALAAGAVFVAISVLY